MKTRATAGFTPSRSRAPRVVLACGRSMIAVNRSTPIPPLAVGVASLKDGKIVALKGLGGYHLACLADDETAVAELRRRKHRDQKPLAIMVQDLDAARSLCEVSPAEEADPDVTAPADRSLEAAAKTLTVADLVAPGNPTLGVMLPYTPLHHLILSELDGKPLVMTSGNASDEPIAYEDDDAVARLAGIADLFLTHDRPIHLRCDDSVTRVVAGIELPLRRSRGYAPAPIELPVPCPVPILALGGQLKATFALGRGPPRLFDPSSRRPRLLRSVSSLCAKRSATTSDCLRSSPS